VSHAARNATSSARRGAAPARVLAMLALLATCSLTAVAALEPAPATADVFGPISLASEGSIAGGPPQQVEYARDAAVSGDGRFVAFDGSVAGVTGVWRRDLATGAIEQVAGGGAELPSISESGQFVSFTTNEGRTLPAITDDLRDEHPQQEAVNVYVRNMGLAPLQEGAFAVASAPSGSSEPLTYSAAAGTVFGSAAAGRSAISADGNEVAFVTTAVSDLVAYPALEEEERLRGEVPVPHTPALQVAVRRLNTRETILVSGEYDRASGETTSNPVAPPAEGEALGAVYPGHARFRPPPEYGEWGPDGAPPGAAISGDGSTVTWMGANIVKQARMLSGEAPEPHYTEPLWRRIASPATSTERVTGGSDPENPGCVASGEASLPSNASPSDPCQGPFVVNTGRGGTQSSGIWSEAGGNSAALGDFVPRISADGYKVAFISTALPLALGENFSADRREGEPADVYVADMHPGLTRDQALAPLTELAGASSRAETEPVRDFAISPRGDQVAFTTRRTAFPLSFPAFVSAPSPEPGLNELFDADLGDGTLTRVTQGYTGGVSEMPHKQKAPGEEDAYEATPGAGSESPSFSAAGTLIAFSSQASNLVVGDGNTPPAGPGDGGDAFVVARQIQQVLPTQQYISPAPATATEPAWRIGVSAQPLRDGSVRLYVEVPGAGLLRAQARGVVLARAPGSAARHRGRRSTVTRTVAGAGRSAAAPGGEVASLVLRLGSPYASLSTRRGGFSASVVVAFSATGHPTLRQSIEVTFHRTHLARKRASKKGARKPSRRASHR
jgi:Tol biopolymer transport system component